MNDMLWTGETERAYAERIAQVDAARRRAMIRERMAALAAQTPYPCEAEPETLWHRAAPWVVMACGCALLGLGLWWATARALDGAGWWR